MTLRDALGALGRRWMLALPILLLTTGACWVFGRPGATYTARETFVIQPPASPQVPNQLNAFRPSLALTASAVAQRLKSPLGERQLRARGVVGEYDLVPRNSGTVQTPAYIIPSVQALVTGRDRATALRSVSLLMSAFNSELAALQDRLDVAQDQRITTRVIAPADAVRHAPSRIRVLAGIGILGIVLAVLGPIWCDELARRAVTRSAERWRFRGMPRRATPGRAGSPASGG